MPLVIAPSATGYPIANYSTGQAVQVAYGENTTNSTKVFAAWNTFEAVPGNLQCTLTPRAVGNTVVIQAHLFWGGSQYTSNDCAANFRVYKSVGGAAFVSAGTYATDAGLGAQATIGVGCGFYSYNWGDTNGSSLPESLLVYDTVTSNATTIYAIYWACGYAPTSRTLYWNRTVNSGNSYNPFHTCSITATELKTY